MASIQTLLEQIIQDKLIVVNGVGNKLRVPGVANEREYHTLRTALVKRWTDHREVLIAICGEDGDPLTAFALCADYQAEEQTGYFYLGKSRKKRAKQYEFSIVSNDDPDATSRITGNDDNTNTPSPK